MSSPRAKLEAAPWTGRTRRYDLIKEGVAALVIVSILVLALSTIFGSPDEKQVTFKEWAVSAPTDFYATAVQELAGTSGTGGYGPPYNNASDGVNLGPLHLAKLMGVTHPVDTVNDFVITPLTTVSNAAPVSAALKQWQSSDSKTQSAWATNYDTALSKANQDPTKVVVGNYGPVPELASGLLTMAQAGSLDGALLSQGNYFQSDNTKQTLFLGDGSYFSDRSTAEHLQGSTWGMMNETGRYPGQAWLWLYSFWYQIPPFNNANNHPFGANADPWILAIMGALTLGLVCIPLIPGLRSLPYKIPIHRLVWKNYYREENL